MFSRNKSPEEICASCVFSARILACVPLPTPGGPSRTMKVAMMISSADEQRVLVTVQFQFGVNIHEGVTHYADNDEQTRRRNQKEARGGTCRTHSEGLQ